MKRRSNSDRWTMLLGYAVLAIPVGILAAIFLNSGPQVDPVMPPDAGWVTVSVPPVAPYIGAVTVCVDGWISHSTGRGTCSYHGGER